MLKRKPKVVATYGLMPVRIHDAKFGHTRVNIIRVHPDVPRWKLDFHPGAPREGNIIGRIKVTKGGDVIFSPFRNQKHARRTTDVRLVIARSREDLY